MLQTALVTGSTGFVGSNLCRLLVERGWQVRALHRPTSRLDALREAGVAVEHAPGDVNDPESLARACEGCDAVFHVAAVADYWRQSVDRLYHVNVEGTRAVCQAALDTQVKRLVLTSSVAALGVPHGQPADESHLFNIAPERFRYGHSKVLAEGVVAEFVTRGLDAVIVNPAAVLGPGDLNQISGSLVTEAARGHLPPFYPPGGVNYIHVNDVCAGHIAAAEKGQTGQRYILGAHNLTHKQVLGAVCRVVGRRPPRLGLARPAVSLLAFLLDIAAHLSPRPLPMSGEQMRLSAEFIYVDSGKAIRELGLPQTPFRQTIEETYAWYKQQKAI
jgi:dihydroflavonol-4-reductase